MEWTESKARPDLVGQTATVTRNLTIVDAREYSTGISVRVQDEMGDEYWTGLDDIDLER
ncbi:hypothetical protein [Cytobacillus purgationiresistens]|uniref:Uncharacterized protein n=1 Tax=Cytobacillus purgationiresistens TaxID=863449 RepID=A0ABU0ACE0_9BACI|nr:hypothetical protein [Cytobacillus purgationiresistens]MDQ0268921.1 hypothetical protein [Cytobacillus purgationiresistens]